MTDNIFTDLSSPIVKPLFVERDLRDLLMVCKGKIEVCDGCNDILDMLEEDFETDNGEVMIPLRVVRAYVSGVKDGNVNMFDRIKKELTE